MTTKRPSRKQVIVSISNDNRSKFLELLNAYILNINRVLKDIKSEVIANFVHSNQAGIIIVMNKVASSLYLQTIEKYVKNLNYIDVEKIKVPHLPQLKLYLKIIGIYYIMESTSALILADIVKNIIKSNHIFNNITIVLRS